MQMQEKTMVSDTLAGINGELVRYAEMIPQTENKELKQVLGAGSYLAFHAGQLFSYFLNHLDISFP